LLIKNGYTLITVSDDSTLGLWICRFCGGDYVINSFTIEKGNLADF